MSPKTSAIGAASLWNHNQNINKPRRNGIFGRCRSYGALMNLNPLATKISHLRCRRIIHALFIYLESFRHKIIVARGFAGLPAGWQRLRSAASIAPYSPLVAVPRTRSRCKRNRRIRRPAGEGRSSPAAPEGCRLFHRHKAPPAPPWGRGHGDQLEPQWMCFPSRVSTFTAPKCNAAHFSSRLCRQSTICLPTAPLFATRDW